jgi:conjugal transfer/entry exclusion protein
LAEALAAQDKEPHFVLSSPYLQNLQQTKRKLCRTIAAQGKLKTLDITNQILKQQAKQCVQGTSTILYWQKSL